jgi:hypothetical protein
MAAIVTLALLLAVAILIAAPAGHPAGNGRPNGRGPLPSPSSSLPLPESGGAPGVRLIAVLESPDERDQARAQSRTRRSRRAAACFAVESIRSASSSEVTVYPSKSLLLA